MWSSRCHFRNISNKSKWTKLILNHFEEPEPSAAPNSLYFLFQHFSFFFLLSNAKNSYLILYFIIECKKSKQISTKIGVCSRKKLEGKKDDDKKKHGGNCNLFAVWIYEKWTNKTDCNCKTFLFIHKKNRYEIEMWRARIIFLLSSFLCFVQLFEK